MIAIAKIDPDKFAPRRFVRLKYFDFIILYYLYSINVKFDFVKPRKPVTENRPSPIKVPQQKKFERLEQKFAPVKLGLSI